MTNKTTLPTAALPARMSLIADELVNLDIAVLSFPFAKEVAKFRYEMERVLSRSKKPPVPPPYRQLNNALLACVPTLTHGFEYFEVENSIPVFQALAVGTPENPLLTPAPDRIQQLVQIWDQKWTQQYHNKGKKDEIDSVCDRFLETVEVMPTNWEWKRIKPETLVRDLNAEKGLGFQAIPSLLATRLHGQKCIIRSGRREQEIQWRKVQGGGSDNYVMPFFLRKRRIFQSTSKFHNSGLTIQIF
ncbi:hypothetical protein WA1_21960 [Scytonema hofmannii PCC 7110]|uniref:Uncharacterized protein n=1 Tax=Scytonema hofmannii PCC 7110 TaxID=128403 RepID=A0A139X9R4_9CYAN|nr:hypothetical protein [Scytonema hofmannii]KYC41372.1 hypothetical protein WA1_21960 [Scytonema hofmannii PCC 7110]